jgi:monothiol glutaredoxin
MSNLPADLERRIESLIQSDRVVLFMKGDRQGPQCGFSAQVVQILDRLVPDYTTVDVLSDPPLREGIKVYSSWPTIPQLYVGGELVGGCDIVKELMATGEIFETLGLAAPSSRPPELRISDAAATELLRLAGNASGRDLHLQIDARLQPGLYFGPREEGEVRVTANGVTLSLDPLSASRADGVSIDVRPASGGPAFHVDVPGAPQVRQLAAKDVKALLDSGAPLRLVDVRTPEERSRARIEGAQLLDDALRAELEALPRDTQIVFHCHHGGRSQHAAEHFLALGFRNVANLVGGIDAWSREVDPSVPRY